MSPCSASLTIRSGFRQSIQRAGVVILGERLQTEILADEGVLRTHGQGGSELLTDEGTAWRRDRLDAGGPAHVTAEVVHLADDRIERLEHRPRVQADPDA